MINALQSPWIVTVRGMLLCAALAVLCGAALAERVDKNKPINLEADRVTHDEARQTSVLEGNVILTKGTLVLRASRIEVRKDSQENQFLSATGKLGTPVFFRQKREALDEFMEGEAAQIDYDGKLDIVRLSGHAVMRRLRGATLADESFGSVIVFNNLLETLTLSGSAASNSAPAQRVRMMLSPKTEAK